MFSKVVIPFLVAVCVLCESMSANPVANLSNLSTKSTADQIRTIMKELYDVRQYWISIYTKLNTPEYKKHPVLSQDDLAEFQEYVLRQIETYNVQVEWFTDRFDYIYRPQSFIG